MVLANTKEKRFGELEISVPSFFQQFLASPGRERERKIKRIEAREGDKTKGEVSVGRYGINGEYGTYEKEFGLELDVLEGLCMPPLFETITRSACTTYVVIKHQGQEDRTKPAKTRINTMLQRNIKGQNLTFRQKVGAFAASIKCQMFVMCLVFLDVGTLIFFTAEILPSKVDCFGRGGLDELVISWLVINVLTIECAIRIYAHGLSFFNGTQKLTNWFDFCVVTLSIGIELAKVVGDLEVDVAPVCQTYSTHCRYPTILPQTSAACEEIRKNADVVKETLPGVGTIPRALRQVTIVVRLLRVASQIYRAYRIAGAMREETAKAIANPQWNQYMAFKFFPNGEEALFLEGTVYQWMPDMASSAHRVVGSFVHEIKRFMQADEEYEVELGLLGFDGSVTRNEAGDASLVRLRVRVTERTANLSQPPYRFSAPLVEGQWFAQRDIVDDGCPPRQAAHLVEWIPPTVLESLTTAAGKGKVRESLEELAQFYNMCATRKEKQRKQIPLKGVRMTKRERVVMLTSDIRVQLAVMWIVLMDVVTLVIFSAETVPDKVDCFGRSHQDEVIISWTVIAILIAEIILRIYGHGPNFFLGPNKFFNLFDLSVVILSIGIEGSTMDNNAKLDVSVCKRNGVDCTFPKSLPQTSALCDKFKNEQQALEDTGVPGVGTVPRALRQITIVIRLIRVVMALHRAHRTQQVLRDKIRQAVAASKRRYQADGFDLDVTYITDRLISMSTPGFGLHKDYRNDIHDVVRFFHKYHYGKFRVYNLCEEFEGDYHPSMLLLQMRRFPFDDHTAPTLKTVLAFCHNAMTFLQEDHQNVIAVHCKGGKGRTGVMMACLLMWSGHRATALDAIELHAFRRSSKYEMCSPHNQTPTGPSQVRYAHYLEAILYNDLNPASEPVLLMRAVTVHKLTKDQYLSFRVFGKGLLVYDSRQNVQRLPLVKKGVTHLFAMPTTLLAGDVKIEFFRHATEAPSSARQGKPKYDSNLEVWPYFQTQFHTLFHAGETEIRFEKLQLDFAYSDRDHTRFGKDFEMRVHLLNSQAAGAHAVTFGNESRRRSVFASIDPAISYGLLEIDVKSLSRFTQPGAGTLVRVEVHGAGAATECIQGDVWNETLSILMVGKETTATVTVLDQFGLVQVAYGVGKLRVSSKELLARRERPPETIERIDEETGAKCSEENPALRLWEDEVLRPKLLENLLPGESPAKVLKVDLFPPNAALISSFGADAPKAAFQSHKKKKLLNLVPANGKLSLSLKYTAWDFPKEFWDQQHFCDVFQGIASPKTCYAGQEILAAGSSSQGKVYMVLKGVVHVTVPRLNNKHEDILVDILGEEALFGYCSFVTYEDPRGELVEMQHVAYTDVQLAVVEVSSCKQYAIHMLNNKKLELKLKKNKMHGETEAGAVVQDLMRRKGIGLSNVAKLKAFYKVHAPLKASQAESIIRKYSNLTELNKVLRVQYDDDLNTFSYFETLEVMTIRHEDEREREAQMRIAREEAWAEEVDICKKLNGPMAAAAMHKKHDRAREHEREAAQQREQERVLERNLCMDQDVAFIRAVSDGAENEKMRYKMELIASVAERNAEARLAPAGLLDAEARLSNTEGDGHPQIGEVLSTVRVEKDIADSSTVRMERVVGANFGTPTATSKGSDADDMFTKTLSAATETSSNTKKSSASFTKTLSAGSGSKKGKDKAEEKDKPPELSPVDEVLFFKTLACNIATRYEELKQESVRVASRIMQSDNLENLSKETEHSNLRLLCISKFALPATEQLLFVAHAAKVWLPAPRRRGQAFASPLPPIFTGHSTKTVHFRCRIIFLSSCIVFEPTLEGDKFLDATYAHHVIDFFRILGVQSVNDGGAGEICCSYLDADTSYDPSLLPLDYTAQTKKHLEFRALFTSPRSRHACFRELNAMATRAAAKRSANGFGGRLGHQGGNVLGGGSIPSLGPLFARKVGEDRKALVEAEKKQLKAAQERAHALQREIEELVNRGAVTNSKAIAVLRAEESKLKAYLDSKLEEFDALGREHIHHRYKPFVDILVEGGALVYVARGTMLVKNAAGPLSTPIRKDEKGQVAGVYRAGEVYGDHVFLSGNACPPATHTLQAGNLGCELVVLSKDFVCREMLADMRLAGGVYREMARAAALRLSAALEMHYGNYWKLDELQASNVQHVSSQ